MQRVSTNYLVGFCRRMGTSLEAGVDVRTALTTEAARAPGSLRAKLAEVATSLGRGVSLADALQATRPALPDLFYELVEVGELSGRLGEVFQRMAAQYEERIRLRRTFMTAATWPFIQLGISLAVIGFVILINGWLRTMPGNESLDMLGLGLVGLNGFVGYVIILAGIATAITLVAQGFQRGAAWTRPIERVLVSLPFVGDNLKTLALSWMAWTLSATLDAGIEVRKALALGLRAARLSTFTRVTDDVIRDLGQNREIHDALGATRVFPQDFIDAVAVGETSGRLPETMATLALGYEERARSGLSTLASLAGFLVWLLIAGFIISMIFRLFQNYVNTINSVL
jgi:type II secretory pathway component PulF